MTKYTTVELSEMQKEEMFRAAYMQLIECIQLYNPEDMRERYLNSTFAFHMMRAEGRKRCYVLTAPHNRWIVNNQEKLNLAHAEFRAWLRLALAEQGVLQVVDASIAYLDPDKGTAQ